MYQSNHPTHPISGNTSGNTAQEAIRLNIPTGYDIPYDVSQDRDEAMMRFLLMLCTREVQVFLSAIEELVG